MKRNLLILALLFAFLLPQSFAAAPLNKTSSPMSDAITLVKKAYLYYNKEMFMNALKMFRTLTANKDEKEKALYYAAYTEYKLVEMSLQKGNEDLFDTYYDSAVQHAEQLANSPAYSSEAKTLLAGIYMMKIANSPMSAVTLTGTIHGLLDDAQKITQDNPRSYLIRGIMLFNTPALFGGSAEKALQNINKAVSLFERDEDTTGTKPQWGHLESLAWQGRVHTLLENYDAALFSYTKALEEEPEFMWVSKNLLPSLKKKMSEAKK